MRAPFKRRCKLAMNAGAAGKLTRLLLLLAPLTDDDSHKKGGKVEEGHGHLVAHCQLNGDAVLIQALEQPACSA